MSGSYDGPTLRSVRESSGVPLRRVARQAGMSHGHLSKVERGEPGRPVTPAVLAAYEKATGIRLTGVAGHEPVDEDGGWRRGHLSEARRRALNAKIAAVAVGGPLGEQLVRILDATGRITVPHRIEEPDVVQVEQVASLCTDVDLRYGGAVADQLARVLLRWTLGLLDTGISLPLTARLHTAIGWLAQRAGWAAFDSDTHETARSLLTVALYAATRADDPDLRAHIIADLAAQHTFLGYPDDALQVIRFAAADERISPQVRMVMTLVKARAFAARGDTRACRQHVDLAEDIYAGATTSATDTDTDTSGARPGIGVAAAGVSIGNGDIPAGTGDGDTSTRGTADPTGWLTTVATRAQLFAGTGHALATLTRRTTPTAARTTAIKTEAVQRLTTAVDLLHRRTHARAAALCLAQLTTLHLQANQPHEAVASGTRLIAIARQLRSARLAEHMIALQRSAEAHEGNPAVKQLVIDLDGLPCRSQPGGYHR